MKMTIETLERIIKELKQHNNDYHYRTEKEFIILLEETLKYARSDKE